MYVVQWMQIGCGRALQEDKDLCLVIFMMLWGDHLRMGLK